jgi:hypothetical protein
MQVSSLALSFRTVIRRTPTPQLHRQHPPTPQNRPLQRLEIPVIEALPDVTREAIERATVSCAQQAHTSTRRQPAARVIAS